MDKNDKIFIAGHRGLVGSAFLRALATRGFSNIITRERMALDLTNQARVRRFFQQESPDYVILAAAKVGGIYANQTSPAEFIYDNLMIECNVIQCAWEYGVKRLLFLGSSCIYPKESPQPIKESYLLSGYLEPTNEAYAIAKIAGLKMCHYYNLQHGADFICAMPTNLYGPNDNFNPETAHVVPALIHKMARAKASGKPIVKLWGTGTPRRELMYIDDLADACLFLMDHYHENKIINIGTGEDIAIKALAELIQTIVGYQGKIEFDSTKPDGTYRKLLDVSVLKGLGWSAKIRPEDGIRMTYDWYLNHPKDLRI